MSTVVLQHRIDKGLKAEAENILAMQGYKPSQAIAIFYTEIKRLGGFPFLPSKIEVPNDSLLKSTREAEKGIGVETYKDDKELFDTLDNL